MTTESSTSPLPADFELAVSRLGLGEWRDRKAAAERLLFAAQERWSDGAPGALVEALIDRVLDLDAVDGRAGAHEVLVGLGSAAAAPIRARLKLRPRRCNELVDVLGEVGDESDLKLLDGLAHDENTDDNLRASAVAAFANLGGAEHTTRLLDLLDAESEMLRLYVLDALREAEARVPVERISGLLDRSVSRKAATEILGLSGSLDALPVLTPLLDNSMRSVRAAAAVALHRLYLAFAGRPEQADLARAFGSFTEGIRVRVRELIAHRDSEVAVAAVDLASMGGDVEALRSVLGAVESAAVYERSLEFVARSGARANPILLELTETVLPEQRERLFRLIGALVPEAVDPRLLVPVISVLEEPNERLAVIACDTLERIGGRPAMAALYRCCSAEGELGEHAADAMASIAERLGGTGHDDLLLIVGGSWPHRGPLARNLCRVVGRLGLMEFVPPLVSMLGSSDVGVRVAASLALGHVRGDHEGVGALCFALADEEPQVRGSACRSLGQLKASRSVQPLLSATADPNPFVRSAAVQALVAIGNDVAASRLRDLVLDDPSPNVVVHAIAGLGRGKDETDLTLLMSLCTSEDNEVVKAAARALGGFRAHRATAALLGLLGHERWDVRWAAAEVLAERGDVTALYPLRGALEVETDALVHEVLQRAIARLAQAEGPGADSARNS